jgi:tetratricopeptide (TPR) repeat protein
MKSPQLLEQALALEKEAYALRLEQRVDLAFEAYDKAASLYRKLEEHLKAAVCFASAATCWNIHTGEQPLRNAATRNHEAAKEAMLAKNYDYARSLFREAAALYEKEGDFENYSQCFIRWHQADAMRAWEIVTHGLSREGAKYSLKDRALAFLQWFFNGWNSILWGYGERPFRIILAAIAVIFVCAFIYAGTDLVVWSGIRKPIHFFEAIYFSVITFTTVGYGDYVPIGWARLVAMFEVFSGVFLVPLFVVGLTRRYLRIYR